MTAAPSRTSHNRKSHIARGWLGPVAKVVLAMLALRLIALAYSQAQLFVDEAQYWLWGQEFALGYYSKPPLIGWVIRLTTEIGGTTDFWVRVAAPVCHAVTAVILAAIAASRFGRRAAVWVAVVYMTLPFVALGSALISTDTVMAPFYAAALYFWLRHLDWGDLRDAILAGLMVGCAMMAKYAGVYFLLGAGLAAIIDSRFRPTLRGAVALAGAALLVLSPNLIWNATNRFVTFRHTADNVGWVKQDDPLAGLNLTGMAEFLAAQFAVIGPVLFATLLFLVFSRHRQGRLGWLALILPPLVAVTVQALLSRAYANWALAAYFPAIVLVTGWLLAAAPRLLWAAVAINGAIAVILPILTIFPGIEVNGNSAIVRYLGRQEASTQIMATAATRQVSAIVTDDRDLIADLFYRKATQPDATLPVYARPHRGRAASYYDLRHPMPAEISGTVLVVGGKTPLCDGSKAQAVATLDVDGGAYRGRSIPLYVVPAGCLNVRP